MMQGQQNVKCWSFIFCLWLNKVFIFGLPVFSHYLCSTHTLLDNRQCTTSLYFSGVKGILAVYKALAKMGTN
jgi:hypothetical protein